MIVREPIAVCGSPGRRAFSLIELAIVIAILGVIALIAAPRLTNAAVRAKESTIASTIRELNALAERYIIEHEGLTIAHNDKPEIDFDGEALVRRLLERTYPNGVIDDDAPLGPYLQSFPVNPHNGLATVRIGDEGPGANSHGWFYDTALRAFFPDDSKSVSWHVEWKAITGLPGPSVVVAPSADLQASQVAEPSADK